LGPLECYIPAPPESGPDISYVPYWRLKGMAFTVTAGAIRSGAVDISHIALDAPSLPWSLGIQTQLARVRLLGPGAAGTFLAPALSVKQALAGYEKNMKQLGIPPWTDRALHRAWIGEQTSLIYYPLVRRDGRIADALRGRAYEPIADWETRGDAAKQPEIPVRFYAATCPDCGRDLDGEGDSLVLTCANCERAWGREPGGLEEISYGVIPERGGGELHGLPFWRIRAGVTGLSLASVADYIRLCNLPRAVTPSTEETPFYFWVPAFKIHAELFMTLIRRMTLFQWQGETEKVLDGLECHPVSIPAGEAVESLKTALADLAADKKNLLPRLGDIGIESKEALLIYLPFRAKGGELTQPQVPLGIQRKALQYGLNI
jgi:hypothetical protein